MADGNFPAAAGIGKRKRSYCKITGRGACYTGGSPAKDAGADYGKSGV